MNCATSVSEVLGFGEGLPCGEEEECWWGAGERCEVGGICRGVYRRRPFLRGVLEGAGVGVFLTVSAVEGGVFGVDVWATGLVDGEAAIIGNPVGREGDVGTVSVPFREEEDVGGREWLSTMLFSGSEEDFMRDRALLCSLERVDIPSQKTADQQGTARAKGREMENEVRGSEIFSCLVLACDKRRGAMA